MVVKAMCSRARCRILAEKVRSDLFWQHMRLGMVMARCSRPWLDPAARHPSLRMNPAQEATALLRNLCCTSGQVPLPLAAGVQDRTGVHALPDSAPLLGCRHLWPERC